MLFFLLTTKSSYAQTNINCEVLNFILRNNEIQSAFLLNKKTNESVVITNMTLYDWEQCKVDLVSGQKVFFKKDTTLTDEKEMLHIVLYDFKKYGQKYKAELHQKETNAYAKIEIKKYRRSMKVVSIEMSHF